MACGYAAIGLIFGPDTARNPTPYVVYVLLWVGLVPVAMFFGVCWRRFNPLRSVQWLVYYAAGLPAERGLLRLPAGLGYWPAAAGLLGFTWLELIAPNNATLGTLRLAIMLYISCQLIAGLVFGSTWFSSGDAFEVWSGLCARLAPIGRHQGRLHWQWPSTGLARLPGRPGLSATLAVLLGSTAYDSAANAPAWFTLVQSSNWPPLLLQTAGFLGLIISVWGLFLGCIAIAGNLAKVPIGTLGGEFAGSLVPIAVGYITAHYWSLLIIEGQRSFIRLSDPLATGANWLGLSNLSPNTALAAPGFVAILQVLAVVTGHILGVMLAHDRALELFRHRPILGQLPLLVMMVCYTSGGIFLLFAA